MWDIQLNNDPQRKWMFYITKDNTLCGKIGFKEDKIILVVDESETEKPDLNLSNLGKKYRFACRGKTHIDRVPEEKSSRALS